MKVCPNCNQSYSDDELNFCLTDGGFLTRVNEDPPATVFMGGSRATDPNWKNPGPLSPWQETAGVEPTGYPGVAAVQGQNQTLPTISLILGIFSLPLICCWGAGMPFSIAAVITGFIGINNNKRDPMRFGGRGLALGGVITGIISLILGFVSLILILISG